MQQEWLTPYLVPVFSEEGDRKTVQELINIVSASA